MLLLFFFSRKLEDAACALYMPWLMQMLANILFCDFNEEERVAR